MALLGGVTGCPGPGPKPPSNTDAGTDSGNTDAGTDSGNNDAGTGTGDAGTGTGTGDAGTGDAGTGDAGTGDAGTGDAGTGTVDAGSALVLKQTTTYYNQKGIEHIPTDFTTYPAELITYEGNQPVTLQGTVVEPGRMHFDVPSGTYLLKRSSTSYILTASREVDLSGRRFGRPDRGGATFTPPTHPHPASLELSGLEPAQDWPFESTLYFNSVDLEESGDLAPSSPLTAGQTMVVDTNAGYTTYYGSIPYFDPAQGDTAWVLQTVNRDAGVPADGGDIWTYQAVARAAHLNPFSFDGGTVTVRAHLTPSVQSDILFEWRRDEFDALRINSVNSTDAGTTRSYGYLDVYPSLTDSQGQWVDYSASPLLSFSPPSNDEQTTLVKRFTFGNPYPSTWKPVAQFTNNYSYNITTHDGSKTLRTIESFYVTEPLSSLALEPVRPRVSLPRDIQVDGTPANTPRLIGTTTPLVTWEAPQLGTPTGYALEVRRLETRDTYTTSVRAARIMTGPHDRSVRLPPGVLTAGNHYILRLTAHHAPGVAPEQVYSRYIVPFASATTTSGIISVP